MNTLEPLLREHPFLRDLRDEHVRILVECAKNLRFAPGSFLFREGEPAEALYLVRMGKIALEVHVPGRGATQVETVHAGDVLGFSWMFPPYRWQLDAMAVDTVVALSLDATCVRRKMEADPAFGYALAKPFLANLHQRLERVRLQRLDLYKTGD